MTKMSYSPRIQKAIDFAVKVHQRQTRKGKEIPYITHPLIVGIILSRVTKDENAIIAGILHDTIEDSKEPNKITKEVIEKGFGKNVADMVNDVTEQDKSQPWATRKKLALDHIKKMGQGSLLVKSADVLHNLTDQIADYRKLGDSMFNVYNAPKEKQLERYEKLINELNRVWSENPLLSELDKYLVEAKKLWA